MKTEKNIFIAFILNLSFSVFEFFGGIFTGSVAIVSDSVHDFGDALSIGISYLLERKSRRQPDETHTYGYSRYSVLGSITTTVILLIGCVMVIYKAVDKLIEPTEINYNGMIIFAVIGFFINLLAALVTRDSHSLNQKAVNLHMLEDVLGWAVVLIGAVIMKFTSFNLIDPIMSLFVALFIIINAIKNLKEVLDLFLEKTPKQIKINELMEHILKIEGVIDVHHIHVRSLDGQKNYASMHIVTTSNHSEIKEKVREELLEHNIVHSTLELEDKDENCNDKKCHMDTANNSLHGHHHH